MLKRYFTIIAACALLVVFSFISSPARAQGDYPEITAQAAVVLDCSSGRVLFSRNPHRTMPPASVTKVMTAVVALENAFLDEKVITSAGAAATGGSSIWLEKGEAKTMEELLLGLLLRSGNDAAIAIAEHIAGDVESFARLMTARARELGALNSSFRNPHGLPHPRHFTTAYDMALISSHAMGLEEFRRIASTPRASISWPGRPWDRVLINQNKLLEFYQGGEGIKTGWTTPAGRCFAGAASRGGRRLVSVVLNAPQMWEDTVALLDFGFKEYSNQQILRKGQHLLSVPVKGGKVDRVEALAGDDFNYPLRRSLEDEEKEKFTYRFIYPEPLEAPLKQGERFGEVEIGFEQEITGSLDLVAGREVSRKSFWERFVEWVTALPGDTGSELPAAGCWK